MNGSIRRLHRWLSLAFTVAVMANLAALGLGRPATWIGVMALVPLIPLLLTGLYLFALPYVTVRRGGHIAEQEGS